MSWKNVEDFENFNREILGPKCNNRSFWEKKTKIK